jgi:hypothetical protein
MSTNRDEFEGWKIGSVMEGVDCSASNTMLKM